jgi:tetratricopeptide (TPR) repeat protein
MVREIEKTATVETEAEGAGPVAELVARGREKRLLLDVAGFEEAVPLLREAIEQAPADAPAYAELSTVYSYWGHRREDACLGFRHEIRMLEYQSLYDLAYDYAAMALRLAPELGASHRAMAAALRRGSKADPERRAREATLAVEFSPGDPEALCERWRVAGYDPRDPAVHEALAREPRLIAVRIDLAAALSERGEYDAALAELEKAHALAPLYLQVYYEIAMILDRKGMRAKALELLRKARALSPEDPLIKQGFSLLGETP